MKLKKILNESSLSRIYNHYTKHDSGTISAFRSARDCGMGEKYTKSENMQRSSQLKSKLLTMGYSVSRINGVYIENYNTPNEIPVNEVSYLVVDINDTGNLKNDLIKLGKYFDQDSITFSNPSGEYYLISSNNCEQGYPGNGQIGVEIKLGKPMFGKSGEFHSKINGRPFIFQSLSENIFKLSDYSISEIRSFHHWAGMVNL